MYILYLNGSPYGRGDLPYIMELIQDYVITNKLYEADEVEFHIVERDKVRG